MASSDRFEYEHASKTGRGQFYRILDYAEGIVLCVVPGEENARLVTEALNLWNALKGKPITYGGTNENGY